MVNIECGYTIRLGNRMNENVQKYGLLIIRIVIAAAFLTAGFAKLAGAEMMVATFDAIGVGQWFRYVAGVIEITGAVLLFVPGKQVFGAGLLTVTMIGAILAHIFVLGTDTMLPAIILGILSAIAAYSYRAQVSP